MSRGLYISVIKRHFDLIGATVGLVCVAPVLAIIAALIYLRLGRPVFFKQRRPGLDATPFELIKFRTMTDSQGTDGRLLPDEERMTPLGLFLRRSSLDELPTLWNVLRGDMSLVGPRPLLEEYLTLYSPEQARRHEVKPGITGWAQTHGRNALRWEEKFRHDLWYVDHCSFWWDVIILARTLWTIVRREGISAHGSATMPRFCTADSEQQNGGVDQVTLLQDELKKAA